MSKRSHKHSARRPLPATRHNKSAPRQQATVEQTTARQTTVQQVNVQQAAVASAAPRIYSIPHIALRPVFDTRLITRYSWLMPLLFMTLAGAYLIGRYGGNWSDSDSGAFSVAIRAVVDSGHLVPPSGVYPNGFSYQAISTFIVGLTGLDVTTLQQLVYPLLAGMVVLPAWLLYRELTGSRVGATLTSLLLFLQPEFLFVVLRSSHEKITRLLMLLCLFWLVRSFHVVQQRRMFVLHVAFFYLTAFALITTNNLLANSFIIALALALVIGLVFKEPNTGQQLLDRITTRRFAYATFICVGLVYLFTYYLYPPAQQDISVLRDIWDRLAALLLDLQTRSTSSYSQVQAAWINLPVYFLLSAANWLALAGSFLIWATQGFRWLIRKEKPASITEWFLWILYTAFGIQSAFSVLVDASGALTSNLQQRSFPSFSIVAVALVGKWLVEWQPKSRATLIRAGMAGAGACIAILSLLKATNEPTLSNKWVFYQPSEIAALVWSDNYLQQSKIWTEFDERLYVSYQTERGYSVNGNALTTGKFGPETHDFLISDITRLRSSRTLQALPVPDNALITYDNGETQFYHLLPETPFQK